MAKMSIRWLLLPLLFWQAWALAANETVNTNAQGVAIHGYDPVAYFTAGEPRPGDARFTHRWRGAVWQFESADNRARFVADPQKYAPQYGGFCAYAASVGQFADIDPQAWSIVNGKLYLNYSPRVRQIWHPRAGEFIADADQLWPDMRP